MLFDTIDPNQEQFIKLTYILDVLYYIVLLMLAVLCFMEYGGSKRQNNVPIFLALVNGRATVWILAY